MIELKIVRETVEEIMLDVKGLAAYIGSDVPVFANPPPPNGVETDDDGVVELTNDNPPPPSAVEQAKAVVVAAAAAQATLAGTTVELDKEGYPWDERIHAGTKTKTVKEIWKRKKGVEDVLYASVRAETISVSEGTGVVDDNTVGIDVPDTRGLMTMAAQLVAAGKTDAPGINTLLQTVGVENVPAILQHPDKINDIHTLLCSIQ